MPRLQSRSFVLLMLLAGSVAAAGCVSNSSATTDSPSPASTVAADWWEHAIPSSLTDPNHDHNDRAQHMGLTTPNFEVLGWDPLVTDYYGTTATGMGCGGVGQRADDERRIAVVHTISTDVAFIVADVTDPAAPFKLGEYLLPNAVIWDATITPDGLHALVGAYPPIFGDPTPVLPPVADGIKAPSTWKVQPMWRDACTGETRAAGPEQYLPLGPGIVMVGLQDPTDPTFEDWKSQPVVGPHSTSAYEIDGTTYVASSVTNLVHSGSYYSFFEVTDTPAGSTLVPLSVLEVPGTPPPTALNGHIDVAIAKHPVTGQILAYLANWDGMYIYDLSTPQVPTQLAVWMDGNAGSLHTTLSLPDLWDDKHYVIAGQEVGEPSDLPSGWVYIIDDTDPTNPVEVGRWTLPVKPKWDSGGLQFSPHYFDVINKTMFVTNYHGGMWAVDISDPTTPKTTGIFVPENSSPAPYGGGNFGPSIEDVVPAPDGTMTIWDGAGGVYVLRFDDTMAMPVVTEWATPAK